VGLLLWLASLCSSLAKRVDRVRECLCVVVVASGSSVGPWVWVLAFVCVVLDGGEGSVSVSVFLAAVLWTDLLEKWDGVPATR
jgi:hypothetical protein